MSFSKYKISFLKLPQVTDINCYCPAACSLHFFSVYSHSFSNQSNWSDLLENNELDIKNLILSNLYPDKITITECKIILPQVAKY